MTGPGRRKPRLAAIAIAMVAAQALISSPTAAADPSYVTILDERLRSTFPDNSPGCIISITRNGQVEFLQGYGAAEVENHIRLTPDSRMAIASVSKQFTALSVLLLEQDGRIRLDAPLSEFVPELPQWADEVTVSHLLHHTSGVRDYISLQELKGYRPQDFYSKDELLVLLARQSSLDFRPGSRALYSNSGYFLLGLIVERVSGTSLRHFMAQRIFEPLGMHDTFLQDDWSEVFDRRAYGYSRDDQGRLTRDLSQLEIVGDGGVVTTARDLLLWDANFYDNRLGGGAALIDQMERAGRLSSGDLTPHAAGLFVRDYRGQRQIGHSGNFGGFKAVVQRYPNLHASISVLCNSDTINAGAESLWITEVALGSLLDPAPATQGRSQSPTDEPPSFEGSVRPGNYYNGDLDVTWRVERSSAGDLVLKRPHHDAERLEGAGRDRLAPVDGWFEIVATSPETFGVVYDDAAPLMFQRVD